MLDTTSFSGPLPWLLGKRQGRSQGGGPKNRCVLDSGDSKGQRQSVRYP